MLLELSTYTYVISMGIVILFQLCLAIGIPWGAASMGGKYPGKYPPKMRIAAVLNILVLIFLSLIVLVRANMILTHLLSFSKFAIWFVVVFSAIGTVLNTITPSKIERIWAPLAGLQLITSLIVALNA